MPEVTFQLKYITSAIVFSSFMGFLLDAGGFITYSLISPISFATGLGLLTIVIALANTPAAKGVALATFAGWLFLFFMNINIPMASPIKELVYATIFVPTIIGVGITFLDYGRV